VGHPANDAPFRAQDDEVLPGSIAEIVYRR
jgi:hypothetical protein